MIAVTMPGNTGDMLYALPTTRTLCAAFNTKCDFYTANTSKHAKNLIAYQPYVNECIIPENYVIERRDMGTQPWQMPICIDRNYSAVYHLGYRSIPNQALHQFIGAQIGLFIPLAVTYAHPDLGRPCGRPYVCISPRGETTFNARFNDIVDTILERNWGVVVIGALGENKLHRQNELIDLTGMDMLDTLAILWRAEAFIGLLSSQLVMANGFSIPRICLNGHQGDMRHVIQSEYNHYVPESYTARDILNLIHTY